MQRLARLKRGPKEPVYDNLYARAADIQARQQGMRAAAEAARLQVPIRHSLPN